jgi:hypothetical protein
MNEGRCDESQKARVEKSTCLTYTEVVYYKSTVRPKECVARQNKLESLLFIINR